MARVYASYKAFTVFATAGLLTASLGVLLGLRFLYFYFFDPLTRDLHIQSLVLAAILLLAGFQMVLTGIVADLINYSRGLVEDISYRLRRMELGSGGLKSPDSTCLSSSSPSKAPPATNA
jgi:hypothetical protein